MSIQSNINQALGTAAGMAAGSKILKNQEKLVNLSEEQLEKQKLLEDIKKENTAEQKYIKEVESQEAEKLSNEDLKKVVLTQLDPMEKPENKAEWKTNAYIEENKRRRNKGYYLPKQYDIDKAEEANAKIKNEIDNKNRLKTQIHFANGVKANLEDFNVDTQKLINEAIKKREDNK